MNTLCVFVVVSTELRFTFNISVGDLAVKYEIGMSNSYKNYCAILCSVPYLFALYFLPLHKDGMTNVHTEYFMEAFAVCVPDSCFIRN